MTVASISSGRGSPGLVLLRIHGASNVALAPTTVRLRVSGSVMLTLTTAVMGCVVGLGASPCDVEVTEISWCASASAADKIGISIVGCLSPVVTEAIVGPI